MFSFEMMEDGGKVTSEEGRAFSSEKWKHTNSSPTTDTSCDCLLSHMRVLRYLW